jgi:hypothetical protein
VVLFTGLNIQIEKIAGRSIYVSQLKSASAPRRLIILLFQQLYQENNALQQFKVSKIHGKYGGKGGELFKKLRTNFEQVCQHIPDTRRPGHNLRYAVADFMKMRLRRIFLPTSVLVGFSAADERTAKPEQLGPEFNATLRTAREAGLLEGYRV